MWIFITDLWGSLAGIKEKKGKILHCEYLYKTYQLRTIYLSSQVAIVWLLLYRCPWASLVPQLVKNLPATQQTWVQSPSWEDPLEKEMATHCSILAWEIPWTEELDRLQSMGSQWVRHNLATKPPLPQYMPLERWWKSSGIWPQNWQLWLYSPIKHNV